jgi:hypothetical protein
MPRREQQDKADPTLGYDLATHEGRCGFIRELRDLLPPNVYAEAREADPHPVVRFYPGLAYRWSTREQVLDWLNRGVSNPEFEARLRCPELPKETVFYICQDEGGTYSWIEDVLVIAPTPDAQTGGGR